jgi:hypothetical protein
VYTRGSADLRDNNQAPTNSPTINPPLLNKRDSHQRRPNLPTPVQSHRLNHWLQGYDIRLREYLVTGFTHGFDIGCTGSVSSPAVHNLKSAVDNPHAVQHKLDKESEAGRVAGPFVDKPFVNFHASPLAVREKKQPGTFRLIHHLSFPDGDSVNSRIASEDKSVSYASIESAIALVTQLGPNCHLSKTDIQSAFRIIPIHPSQYHLLGFT